LAGEIKSIWKLNNVSIYPSVISAEGVVMKNFKTSREYRFNQNNLKSGANRNTVADVSYSMQIPRTCCFTSGYRMNFLPLIIRLDS
jgi:hypothetical protein